MALFTLMLYGTIVVLPETILCSHVGIALVAWYHYSKIQGLKRIIILPCNNEILITQSSVDHILAFLSALERLYFPGIVAQRTKVNPCGDVEIEF